MSFETSRRYSEACFFIIDSWSFSTTFVVKFNDQFWFQIFDGNVISLGIFPVGSQNHHRNPGNQN